ncbi:sirohydrochlorin chelatase [Streptomyces triticagri]|uniref:Sirohydrochlorin chelatase n=1 Tax=Streptomyces triticagri TaxID=2293568 RepID=A0A372LX95_9ACTN|nr:sirohydrochlorin chelatase [Streptomyces triticagri]RFU83298.1 sirohydrochlorin chelatase [Streptomyces triticagri]
MTESKHHGGALLDSAAQLFGRINTQLGAGLGLVSPDGTRRQHTPTPTLVVVAHGSRDPRTPATVRRLLDVVRALRPGLPVRLGHIELNAPLLGDTLDDLTSEPERPAVLVPLLLGRGHHVKRDLPAAAAACRLDIRVAAPLGPHPLLVEALHERLTESGWPAGAEFRRSAGVVLAAAGSRDPDGRTDTERTAGALAARLGVPVRAAYASAAGPSVSSAIRTLAARGRGRVAVASYFTAPGRFAAQAAEAAPWIVSAPLGAHPAVARLLLDHYDTTAARPAAPASLSRSGV